MKINFDTTVTVVDGDFRILMGQGLTIFYVKEQSRFVLRTESEIDKLMEMLSAAKTQLNSLREAITTPQTI